MPARPEKFTRYCPANWMNFKAPRELWIPLSKTVLSKCCFINKGLVNFEMAIKLKVSCTSDLYIFSYFYPLHMDIETSDYMFSCPVDPCMLALFICMKGIISHRHAWPIYNTIICSETLSMQKRPNKCSSSVPSSGQINEFSYVQSHKITLMYLKLKLL